MTDWPVKTLGSICKIYQPQTIGTKDLVPDGPYVVYGANGPIGRYSRFNHENAEVTVTCRGATCGTVNVTPPRVWITGNAMVVCPNEDEISKPMLRYFLEGLDYSSVITGTAQPQITRATLAPVEIPIPPLEEQKRIVALLDDATSRITELTACYEQARTHANDLFTSALRGALEGNPDWPVKTLGDVCDFQNGYAFRSSEFVKNGHALIRIKNVQQGEIIPSDDAYVRIPKDGSLDEFVLDAGDILISLTGHLGRVGRMDRSDLPAALNQRVAKVIVKSPETVCAGFLFRVLDSQWFRDQVEIFGRGAAQQNVGTSDISKIKIAVPPLVEQKRIVERLDQMRGKTAEIVAAYDAKLQAAKNLRQSILEAAFAGEL